MQRLFTTLLVSLLAAAYLTASSSNVPDEANPANFDKLWNYDDPAGTEKKFRALIPSVKASGLPAYLELLTQIARTQGLQGQFAQAHTTLDEVEHQLPPELSPSQHQKGQLLANRPRVRYLLERGRVYNSSKAPNKARPLFVRAWKLARTSQLSRFAVDAAHMMGIIEPPASALKWNEKAIDLAEHATDPATHGWLGSLYNNTGWTYYDKGDYKKALDLLEKAQAFIDKQGSRTQKRIAKYSVAKALRSLGRVDEAYAMQLDVQKQVEQDNDSDGYVSEELAECLLAMKRPEEARTYFLRAYEVLSKDKGFVDSEPKRLKRLKEMSGN